MSFGFATPFCHADILDLVSVDRVCNPVCDLRTFEIALLCSSVLIYCPNLAECSAVRVGWTLPLRDIDILALVSSGILDPKFGPGRSLFAATIFARTIAYVIEDGL